MKQNGDEIYAQKLKKAKYAVWFARWLNLKIPEEYHCMVVNLECCSLSFLECYISSEKLCEKAELLLVEKYLVSNPEIIISYVSKHNGSKAMHFEILKNAPREVIVKIIKHFAYPQLSISTTHEAQVLLIKRNDFLLFKYVLLKLSSVSELAIAEIIKQQRTDMLRLLFTCKRKLYFSSLNLTTALQKLLINQGNAEMIDCFNQYREFDQSVVKWLINEGNIQSLKIILKRRSFSDEVQEIFVKNGNKKMIALYLKKYPMSLKGQIALIDLDFVDLLKLHYLKYGVEREAMVYLLSLKNFKAYLDI